MIAGKVFSFSVFDTLLTRQTATARGVFCAMQHSLRLCQDTSLPLQFVEEFLEIRTSAETSVRASSETTAITLDALYAHIGSRFPTVSAASIAALQQLELDTEEALIIGIPAMLRRVNRLIEEGARVILICDTYLSEQTIRSLLYKVDTRIAQCPLYISSCIKRRMSSAELFRHVLHEEGIHPKQLLHTGSDGISDSQVPRALGIRATLCTAAYLSDFELYYFEEDHLFSQLLAGVSKTFRLSHPDASSQAIVGACLAGPMFYGFILDLLRDAETRGLSRLYFIARDGMIFLRIAQEIAKQIGCTVELKYLYGSRRAFRLPSVFEITPREYGWLAERIPTLSLAMLAERIEMTGEALHALLPDTLRQQIPDLHASLPLPLTTCILHEFEKTPAIRDQLLDNARQARDAMIEYLDQEGFFDHQQVGTVDIGWMGGSQDSLYKIAASHRRDIKIQGYYFGLFHYSRYTSQKNNKKAYAILPNHTQDNIVALHTELLAQADHGQTIRYERMSDGRMAPKLADDGGHLQRWGVNDFHAGATWFSSEYTRIMQDYPLVVQNFLSVIPRLFCLLKKPSDLIAKTLGSIPYSGDHCDLRLRESAPELTLREAFSYSFLQRYENRRLMTEWYEATLVRSAFAAGLVLRMQPGIQTIKYAVKHAILFVLNWVRSIVETPHAWLSKRFGSVAASKSQSPRA